MKPRRLITSALPYVNNIPHLGNLIQLLSADVYARYCRLAGYETLYICGTDEYGTATETRAHQEGITPQELCDRYYTEHKNIYDWFGISFDNFGRTSKAKHSEITQDIFLKLYQAGYICKHTTTQLYSETSQLFLADRYVRGVCPHCAYEDARGDQCEHCGKLLDPMDLICPRSILDDSTPIPRETTHLYIDLPKLAERLEEFLHERFLKGEWSKNAVQMTKAWLRDGLKERTITRDLSWGIPVPLEEFKDKVFYVWFDAPIGYISITAEIIDDWQQWWKNPDEVTLVQFVGKDNIPFHTVVFPSSLLGTGEPWTLLNQMSSSEYLTYEGGAFSKSRGRGIFGSDVQKTGIPVDVWRFYLMYNRPESADYAFSWSDFQTATNTELIGNFANFVNRILKFVKNVVQKEQLTEFPAADYTDQIWKDVREAKQTFLDCMEKAQIRKALRTILALSDRGNKLFQQAEPWKHKGTLDTKLQALLGNLVRLVVDLAILIEVFLPKTAKKILSFIDLDASVPLNFDALASNHVRVLAIHTVKVLFSFLEDSKISTLQSQFSTSSANTPSMEQEFSNMVSLCTARITEARVHPDAEKLYVIALDDGSAEGRQIVSGIREYYSVEDLRDKVIIVVKNLKPAKLRGILSQGMLLAAEQGDVLEVLEVPWAKPGDLVYLEGMNTAEDKKNIDIKKFSSTSIEVHESVVHVGALPLVCAEKIINTQHIVSGSVS